MYEKQVDVAFDEDFTKDVLRLPGNVQTKLADLLVVARWNIFDPRLHTKRL